MANFYFKHDCRSRNNHKASALISDYGPAGYGIYWGLMEVLHEAKGVAIELTQELYTTLAQELNTTADLIKKVVADCINVYELLKPHNSGYTSSEHKVTGYRFERLYSTQPELWKALTAQVFLRDDYTCAYCNQRGGILEPDHIHPISKGGSNDLSNLVTACRLCNRQKKDKTVQEFLTWRINNAN